MKSSGSSTGINSSLFFINFINSALNTMSHANVAQLYPGGYVPEEQQASQLKRRVAELEAENRKLKRGKGPAQASSGKQTWTVKNDS